MIVISRIQDQDYLSPYKSEFITIVDQSNYKVND